MLPHDGADLGEGENVKSHGALIGRGTKKRMQLNGAIKGEVEVDDAGLG